MSGNSQWSTRATLLGKIKDQHNNDAWEDYVFYYRDFVYNVVRAMGLQHHDAEEIVQQVMLVSWQKLPEFEYDPRRGRFRGWLCTVTGNMAKKYLRDKKTVIDPNTVESLETLLDSNRFEEIAELEWRKYIAELAWKSIEAKFDKKVSEAFKLYSAGTSPKEVAKKLDIAESSVYVYKSRVSSQLQKEIKRLEDEL